MTEYLFIVEYCPSDITVKANSMSEAWSIIREKVNDPRSVQASRISLISPLGEDIVE